MVMGPSSPLRTRQGDPREDWTSMAKDGLFLVVYELEFVDHQIEGPQARGVLRRCLKIYSGSARVK